MALILMLLTALPLGYFVRNRTAAYIVYLAAAQFIFIRPDCRTAP